jgi:hypothetical protein
MRMLTALVAVSLLSACTLSLAPLSGNGDNCSNDSSRGGQSCTPTNHTPIVVVIAIGPSRQYSDNNDGMCYQFSPAPASVLTGGTYSFQNNTSSSITIVGSNQIPWATVGAGASSPSLTVPATGSYGYGVQGCRGVSGTAWYGVLTVSSN